jgi:hypothetical protein
MQNAILRRVKMAHLTKCRVCGGIASSAANTCPHCGDPYITDDRPEIFYFCPFMSSYYKKEKCKIHCHFFISAHNGDGKKPVSGDDYHGCAFQLMLQNQHKMQADISTLKEAINIKPKGVPHETDNLGNADYHVSIRPH